MCMCTQMYVYTDFAILYGILRISLILHKI